MEMVGRWGALKYIKNECQMFSALPSLMISEQPERAKDFYGLASNVSTGHGNKDPELSLNDVTIRCG
jgi:hypothetical protein